MIRIILCEGKTDAILLGYYLAKVANWKFSRSAPSGLAIKPHSANENIAWYKKDSKILLLCAVGGKDNFASFFSRDLKNAITKTDDTFSHIVIVTDRDNREVEEIEHSIASEFSPFFNDIKNREWKPNQYIDTFGIEHSIDSLLLVIPNEQQGALETVMLSAISEDPYDKNIVEKCTAFVEEIRSEANRYISTDRLQLKANLSTVWAIQSPEKAFDFIDEQIRSVNWEEYAILHDCFEMLKDL